MTDRELLEKAAKAAGYTEFDWLSSENIMNVYDDEGYQYTFNPLKDDGDALRLAVELKMNIERDFDRVQVYWHSGSAVEYLYDKPVPTDPYAETRRAIVRAAAEIGEQK